MESSLHHRILNRELGSNRKDAGIRGLYGHRAWVDNLDIVNELGGHSGCVNALSWSKSGRLLASGSDDTHLLIHAYQPESTNKPFLLTTSLSTGHKTNIFSVKFMPQSNDNTVVTAAGDSEVRVFDLEYSGKSREASDASSIAATRQTRGLGARGLGHIYQNAKFLSDGNTNARVYRSHSDRVKRIVTESSPYLFLTCSEDGEVRQFDTRLPSSAYPAPQGSRTFRLSSGNHDDSNVPPPLISYKRYRLDLNTISCSASQPHYIALGGAHLHCFLHDRRMTGRDSLDERGIPGFSASSYDSNASQSLDDLMGEATRCVRRFAPNGRKKMGRTENVHVTACKISDAHPNEMIASWSGDHIYSFDLANSPDAEASTYKEVSSSKGKGKSRAKGSRDRKRKRKLENSSASIEGQRRGDSRPRRSADQTRPDDVVLRVRYENGQSEDIPVESTVGERVVEQSRESVLSESQKRSARMAKSVVKIRKLLFSLDASAREDEHGSRALSAHSPSFTSALGSSAALLPEMDEIMRTWTYPLNPSSEEVAFHATLRQHRDSARRFVQASGTLAKVLGGRLYTASSVSTPALDYFDMIKASDIEGPLKEPGELFRYTFLKAILLWLDGGVEALLDGFKKKSSTPGRLTTFFPIPEDADHHGIDDHLIPLLVQLAATRRTSSPSTTHPIANVDASRFETDSNRYLFPDESAAVIAFSHAVKIPLQDMSKALTYSGDNEGIESSQGKIKGQDKRTALKYWGSKVGRGLLLNAGEGVNFALVDRAFGGLGLARNMDEGRVQDDIDTSAEEQVVTATEILMPDSLQEGDHGIEALGATASSVVEDADQVGVVDNDSEDEGVEKDSDEDEDADSGDEDDDDEALEDDGGLSNYFFLRHTSERNRLRSQVQKDVSVMPHTRKYNGHCNVKTVKDVNFFGLEDEYVVSGCDSGHLFIWDRKTSQLLNILKGDGEVVNVIQGHPYEPMLAVSGIDHTIKIFSPDNRAQYDARWGRNLNVDPARNSVHSSLSPGLRRRRPPRPDPGGDSTDRQGAIPPSLDSDDNEGAVEDGDPEILRDGGLCRRGIGLPSRRRMHDSYQIISQNDIDRAGGQNERFITSDMIAQLAHIMRRRRTTGGEGGEGGEGDGDGEGEVELEDEDGVRVVLDDRCEIM